MPYNSAGLCPEFVYSILGEGIFNPVIDREYSLGDIAGAYDYVMTGEKSGNVIVSIEHNTPPLA